MTMLGPLRRGYGGRYAGDAPTGPAALRFKKAAPLGPVYVLQGVSRDSTGVVLGDCRVDLYYADGDLSLYGSTQSDPVTGAYTFMGGDKNRVFFARFYKPGAPDVAGTTKNNLTFI